MKSLSSVHSEDDGSARRDVRRYSMRGASDQTPLLFAKMIIQAALNLLPEMILIK